MRFNNTVQEPIRTRDVAAWHKRKADEKAEQDAIVAKQKAELDTQADEQLGTAVKERARLLRETIMIQPQETLPEGVQRMSDVNVEDVDIKSEADAFVAANVDTYVVSGANFRAISGFMFLNGIAGTTAGFQYAYDMLSEAGIAARKVADPQPEVKPVTPVEIVEEKPTFVNTMEPLERPSGIETAGYSLIDGSPTTYTDFQLEQMNSRDYAKALRIPRIGGSDGRSNAN